MPAAILNENEGHVRCKRQLARAATRLPWTPGAIYLHDDKPRDGEYSQSLN